MTSPRTYRVLGGTCQAGHLLTPETAYVIPYQASNYHHRNRPAGPIIRCQICHLESSRRRLGWQPRKRIDPDAPHTCICGTTMPRRDFGIRCHNQDGTLQFHLMCGPCRGALRNKQAREATRARREREREEREGLTKWLIDQAWRLKRERQIPLATTRELLGVTLLTWSSWKCGEYLPKLARLGAMVETMRILLVKEGLM